MLNTLQICSPLLQPSQILGTHMLEKADTSNSELETQEKWYLCISLRQTFSGIAY